MPCSRKEKNPDALTTTWSARGIPRSSSARCSRRVTSRSSELGVESPEGWLWTATTAAAACAMAGEKTSRGWTNDADNVPMLTVSNVASFVMWRLSVDGVIPLSVFPLSLKISLEMPLALAGVAVAVGCRAVLIPLSFVVDFVRSSGICPNARRPPAEPEAPRARTRGARRIARYKSPCSRKEKKPVALTTT